MTFKKMAPEDFKVGRKYRNNHPNYGKYIYTYMEKPRPILERSGACIYVSKGKVAITKWEWEEIVEKKRVFK